MGSRSWAGQGHSISTSGSAGGSPTSRSEPAIATTPAAEASFMGPSHLDVQDDDDGSPSNLGGKKKRRAARQAATGDKNGRGLRQFSMKVCEKVESKGRTTYNEVADELVAEFANPSSIASPDQQQFEEKNIRRRVYDALNVLMAMDIISKDKKEIQWKGLTHTGVNDMEELKAGRAATKFRIEQKAGYLQELEEQMSGLENIIQKNEQRHGPDNNVSGVSLPFILIQCRPHATVEVEISEDMQLVHFDFNSTPFELHDDAYVLKEMGLSRKRPGTYTHGDPDADGGERSKATVGYPTLMPNTSRSNARSGPSTPVPDGRVSQSGSCSQQQLNVNLQGTLVSTAIGVRRIGEASASS